MWLLIGGDVAAYRVGMWLLIGGIVYGVAYGAKS